MRITPFGRHLLTEHDDGVIETVYDGHVSHEEMQAMIAHEDLSNVPDVRLLLVNMRAFGGMDPRARRLGATAPKPSKRYFTAYIGVGFGLRVFVDMWSRAANFIHGEKYFPGFFDDERSARAWLLAQREAFERGEKR